VDAPVYVRHGVAVDRENLIASDTENVTEPQSVKKCTTQRGLHAIGVSPTRADESWLRAVRQREIFCEVFGFSEQIIRRITSRDSTPTECFVSWRK